MADDPRYGVAELAELGGVSRRTVRYYVQEGLLPAPYGVGRGDHYGPAHLERLIAIRRLQEQGHALDDIRRDVTRASARRPAVVEHMPPLPERVTYRRLRVAPGVELHLADDVRLPSPARLMELAEWCRQHLSATSARHEED